MHANVRWSAITIDCSSPRAVADFWAGLLGGELSVPLPGWLRLGTVADTEPAINFQPVPEPKQGKTRTHLDLVVDDLDAAVTRIEALGGRALDQRYDYPEGVVRLMADPEGNEFCIVRYTTA